MVFLFLLLTVILFVMLVFLSKVRIEIINFQFFSGRKRHINQDYELVIKLCIIRWIPILKIRITKAKLEKWSIKEKVKKIDFTALEKMPNFNQEMIKAMKKLDIRINQLNLWIDLGTQSASLTSIIVPAISTAIAVMLRKRIKKFENQKFIINPIYQNQNLVNLSISGIFEMKTRHIITITYHFMKKEKKGVKKYERTSNRGAYDYSYE